MLLEKCFNFHIPIRWHLISQLVGEGVKVVVSAVTRAPALVILLRAGLFFRRGQVSQRTVRKGFGPGARGLEL